MITIENLIRSLYSAGVERAKALYVVSDAIIAERGFGLNSSAEGPQILRDADAEMQAVITCKWS